MNRPLGDTPMRYLLILCLTLPSHALLAETYRWTDSSGRTMITDSPPPGSTKSVLKAGAKESPSDPTPFAVKKAMEAFPVLLYTAAACVDECKQARDLLNERGVPFTEKMLQSPEELAELKQLVGDTFVPTLKVGKQPYRGFEPVAYHNLLDLAGYPKTAAFGAKPSGGLSK